MFCPSARRSVLAGLSTLAILVLPVPAGAQSAPAASDTSAQRLTRIQLSGQLDASFKAVDTNGDKALSTTEIDAAQKRKIAEAQGTLIKRLEAEFARLDGNKDGQVSLAEFKAGAPLPSPKITPATEMLQQLDRNKDGKVGVDEYRATPLANFDRIDLNKDGAISADEQSAAIKRR